MGDSYVHNGELVSETVNLLTNDLSNYSAKIAELETLINTMNGSSSWKDELLKTSFIETAEQYISVYKNYIEILEGFIKYLDKKNNTAMDLESAYS